MHRKIAVIMVTGILVGTVQAALIWTGGGDEISLYQEANWQDDQGNVPAANTINSGSAVSADTGTEKLILISSGTGSPSGAGGNFLVGGGVSLTVSGGKTLYMTQTGANGYVAGGWNTAGSTLTVSGGATATAEDWRNFDTIIVDNGTLVARDIFSGSNQGWSQGISILNGGSVTAGRIGTVYNEAITVDGTSSLELTTTDATPFALVDLAEGAQLTLSSLDYFTTHGARITVGGVSYAENSSILSFVGTTATAIPEPAVIGLIAMMGGSTLFIRRRFMP